MKDANRLLPRSRLGAGLTGVLILGFAAGPASAGGGNSASAQSTKTAGSDINPTNIALVQTDLCCAVAPAPSSPSPPEVQMGATGLAAPGAGVTVAILDGGFNIAHPDIARNISNLRWDAIDNDSNPNDLGNGIDDDGDGIADRCVGHGTFVAGMVLRIAPGATIVPIRVRDDEGRGPNSAVSQGIAWAIARRVNVINLSLALADRNDQAVASLLSKAAAQGISIVVSAGNDGTATLTNLASISGGIAAGAVDSSDRVAAFSNCIDAAPMPGAPRLLFAPGVDLFGPIGSPTTDARGVWSGTSFSAGLLSGAVAVVRQAKPWLSPAQIASLLASTADPVTDAFGNRLVWSGRVNVARAVTR